MSAAPLRAYRFASAAHWACCVRHGLGQAGDTLRCAPPPSAAVPQADTGACVDAVASGEHGMLCWRTAQGLRLRAVRGASGAVVEIDRLLQHSPRLVMDREALWAFAAGRAVVGRFDARGLLPAWRLDLDALSGSADVPLPPVPRVIKDLAADGCGGLWLLLRAGDGRAHLLRLDRAGHVHGCWPVPAGVAAPARLAFLRPRSPGLPAGRLALLSADACALALVDLPDLALHRVLGLEGSYGAAGALGLASDGHGRLVLWGTAGQPAELRLLLLDAGGDVLAEAAPFHEAGQPPEVRDAALAHGALWLATGNGLWRVDTGVAAPRTAGGRLATPVLESPPSEAGSGWLRAEIDVTLPVGATLEVRAGSTDDPDEAAAVRRLLADAARTGAQRLQALWEREGGEPSPLVLTGAGMQPARLEVPLLAQRGRWLWLELRLLAPPDVAPPVLHGLQVRYPERSLADFLPGLFRDGATDPSGVLRRLLGVVETTTQALDERIAGLGADIDPATAPDQRLDALAQWLGLPWDDALPPAAKRALLLDAPAITAGRGTRAGLQRLLQALVAPLGRATVADLMVEHPPGPLGGRGQKGARLPLLLAGTAAHRATLGGKAVLGRARLPCAGARDDPLQPLAPTVLVELSIDAARRHVLVPLLDGLLVQFVPVGVRWRLRWRDAPHGREADGWTLDARGPGRLGSDGWLSRTVLSGRDTASIDASGVDLGFRLR